MRKRSVVSRIYLGERKKIVGLLRCMGIDVTCFVFCLDPVHV